MPKDFNRADRVADAVQRSLARLIPLEVHDPRLGMVNINTVSVSRDLANAKVYVTFVGQTDPKACFESVEVLNAAASYLRSLLGKDLSMRSLPRLQFVFDESAIRGQEIRKLIDDAVAADNANRGDRGE